MPRYGLPTDEEIRILRQLKKKLDNARGPGVRNTPDDLSIAPPPKTSIAQPQPPSNFGIPAKITGTFSGAGKYQASLYTMKTSIDETTDASESDLVDSTASSRVVAINLYEWGAPAGTHAMSAGTPIILMTSAIGSSSGTDGLPVYYFMAITGASCG